MIDNLPPSPAESPAPAADSMSATPSALTELFALGLNTTPDRKLTSEGVRVERFNGQEVLVVEREALLLLAQLRAMLDDPEATANDRFVACYLLKNANVAAGGVLQMCQNTGTAILMGKKGRLIWTEGQDEAALAHGIRDACLTRNLRPPRPTRDLRPPRPADYLPGIDAPTPGGAVVKIGLTRPMPGIPGKLLKRQIRTLPLTMAAARLHAAGLHAAGLHAICLTLMLFAAPAFAQQQDTCSRDLFMTDASLRTSLQKLEAAINADQAAKCIAWRSHVTAMRKASGVFARCMSGRDRAENVGQMDGSVADLDDTIAKRCGAQPRTQPARPVLRPE